MRKAANYFGLFFFCLLVLAGCREKNRGDQSNNPGRTAMLIHYADNLIKPALDNSLQKIEVLKQKATAFTANPDATTLTELQGAWTEAHLAFQHINSYNFGPAAEQGIYKSLAEEIATFPVNDSLLEIYVNSGDTTFANFARDTRGLLAVEYLIYGHAGNTEVINAFANSQQRKNYLLAVINHLLTKVSVVTNNWQIYRSVFINNNGTDAGSSISLLYNEWLKSYEVLKNYKLGLPSGIRPGQVQPEPEKVECYYSRLSVKMLREHFKSITNIWHGKKLTNDDGAGLQEYLVTCVGGPELSAATLVQIQNVQTALDNIPESSSLSALIVSNDPRITTLNAELQKLTRYFKSDMSSVMGISITYSSGDGD